MSGKMKERKRLFESVVVYSCIIVLLSVMILNSNSQLVTTTLEQRAFNSTNNTYCIYNQYNNTDIIYECVNRTKHPINDTACFYEIDLKNYMCQIPYDYTGGIECLFDYDSYQVWNEQYICFSGINKCGGSAHPTYEVNPTQKKQIASFNLTKNDTCRYQFFVAQYLIDNLISAPLGI